MRKSLVIMCILILAPGITIGYASPNANYVDGADVADPTQDIDYINVTQGWINVTYVAAPNIVSTIYQLSLSYTGITEQAYLDGSVAVVVENTTAWNIVATVSGWGAIYFKILTILPGVDQYPNDGSYAGPDPDALSELSVFLALPLLAGLLAIFALYRRK